MHEITSDARYPVLLLRFGWSLAGKNDPVANRVAGCYSASYTRVFAASCMEPLLHGLLALGAEMLAERGGRDAARRSRHRAAATEKENSACGRTLERRAPRAPGLMA